jgi:cell division protein FtsI (penicillin-binding protein 3)
MKNRSDYYLTNARLFIVFAFMMLFGLACVIRIGVLITRYGDRFRGEGNRCWDKTLPDWENHSLAFDSTINCIKFEKPKENRRGDIYDCKGRLLASSTIIYDIYLDGKHFHKLNENAIQKISQDSLPIIAQQAANQLYSIFGKRFNKDLQYFKDKMADALLNQKNIENKKSTLILTTVKENSRQWITEFDREKLDSLPPFDRNVLMDAFHFRDDEIRSNPYGELAKRAIGKWLKDDKGEILKTGLEFEYDSILKGAAGKRQFVRWGGRKHFIDIPLETTKTPVNGQDLYTTLDLDIQKVTYTDLMRMLRKYEADWGCAIVMETKTGKVKAIANLTRQDTSKIYKEEINYLINWNLEPGSTFKLASLLAYLEATKNDQEKKYPIETHDFYRNGIKETISDKHGRPEGSAYPIEIFQRSSNPGIVAMILDKYGNSTEGYKKFLNKLDEMGITMAYHTDLGYVKAMQLKRETKVFRTQLNAFYGTAFYTTPLHILTYFNAVANNGKMLKPYFIEEIKDGDNSIKKFEPKVLKEQICSFKTIEKAQEYLKAVVYGEYGTAKYYSKIPITYAGKTGTRDVVIDRKYDLSRNYVFFCGYFPADNPQYTALVVIYDVPKKSSIAVEAFAKIATDIYQLSDEQHFNKIVLK